MMMEALMLYICLFAATVAGLQDYDAEGGGNFILDATERPAAASKSSSLQFVYPMKNSTRAVGEALKLKCEVRGSPPPSEFRWFVNEAPLLEERGRVKRKGRDLNDVHNILGFFYIPSPLSLLQSRNL